MIASDDIEMKATPAQEEVSSDAEAQEPLLEMPGKAVNEQTSYRSSWRTGVVVTGLLLGMAALCKYGGGQSFGLTSAGKQGVMKDSVFTEPVVEYTPVHLNYQDFPLVETTEPYMDLKTVSQNNLGGRGPDDGAQEMRYPDVLTTTTGEKIDLVVTASSPYSPKKATQNGMADKLGQINMRGGASTDYIFRLVKSGSLDIVRLKEFYFTVYDIDKPEKASNLMQEMVSTSGFEYAFVSNSTTVDIKPRSTDNPPQFWGTAPDSTGQTNPTDPAILTPDQESRTVTFLFPYTGEIKMTMATPGGSSGSGRNFLFSGYPAFLACINQSKTADLSWSETVYSNLGGKGPDEGSPQGMRFKDVFTYKNGSTVDLIVKDLYGYIPAKPEKSGSRDNFGCINMRTKATANFSFEFVDSVTSARTTLNHLKFTFLDMDGHDKDLALHERIIMGGFQKAFVTDNTEVVIEPWQPEGLTRFSSSQPDVCGGCNNPDDPNALTPEQQARTFTVLIEEASYFTLIIDLSDGQKKMPRSIYFAGTSTIGGGEEIVVCP